MPWKATDVMTVRAEMMLEWKRQRDRGEIDFSALCREYGVSRQTGYKWLRRFHEGNESIKVLSDRSRRPRTSPSKTSDFFEGLVRYARDRHPAWGPRKLLRWLKRKRPKYAKQLPGRSTIANILKREGLVQKRVKARQKTPPYTQPFAECTAPNMVWCADFKGWFYSGDGLKIYPLTITDASSRFIIRCVALLAPNGDEVRRVFESAFRQYGLPNAIRTDNGSPFATVGAAGLSALSVWWIKHGISHERIEKGKPQQNGRHERMHRSMEHEMGDILRDQRSRDIQCAFRRWVREFNYERPHEALGDDTPSDHYAPSTTRYPRPPTPDHNRSYWGAIVDAQGDIHVAGHRYHINRALCGEVVGLRPKGNGENLIHWFDVLLGKIDERLPKKGLMGIPGKKWRPTHSPDSATPRPVNVYTSRMKQTLRRQRQV